MNVQERILRERIDPSLTPANLSSFLSRALEREVRAGSPTILTGGCWNRVVAVGLEGEGLEEWQRELVVKVSPETEHEGIMREFRVLGSFAEVPEMHVPRPVFLEENGESIPGTVLVMERIRGVVLHEAFPFLRPRDAAALIEEIARTVGALHRRTAVGFGGVELPEEERSRDWADFWLPRFDAAYRQASGSGLFDPAFLRRIDRVRPEFSRWLDIGPESTLCHYDIWAGNVMVDGNGRHTGRLQEGRPRVSGYIDVQGIRADYARELSFLELFGLASGPFFDVYREYHRIDDGYELRRDLYNLKMNLRHVMMYPGEDFYRRGAESCLRTLEAAAGR